jgi:hydroxymethylpyrimidine/phosphomethylpyrimidine kinase
VQNQPSTLILSFGVSDPVGALGVQADLAACAAHGCHLLSVVTGQLVSDSARVYNMQEADTDLMVDQARMLLEDMPVAAFKIGAIASIEQASAIAEIVSDYTEAPLILDPFLSSLPDSGLHDDDMLGAIRQILAPQASVLMLSQVELARLAETWRDGPSEGMLEADVAELTGSGCEYVLVTGTGSGGKGANTMFSRDGVVKRIDWQHLPGPFVGAGCTLSGALTAQMALGVEIEAALAAAHEYTAGALAHARRLGMGRYIPNRFYRSGAS